MRANFRVWGALFVLFLIAGCASQPAAPAKAPEATAKATSPAPAAPAPAAPAKAAPAPAAKVPGVTDTEILVGNYSPQSGPVAAYGAAARILESYFKYINDQGGFNGRKLKLIIRDDSFDPSKTVAVTKQLVESDGVFAIASGIGTATTQAVLPYLEERGIPLVPVGGGASIFTNPIRKNVFAVNPAYLLEGRMVAEYAVDELKGKKIAIFYQNDATGKEGLEGVTQGLKAANQTLVASVSYEISETDYSSHVIKLRQAGADVVIMFSFPNQTGLLRKEAAKLGWKPKWLGSLLLADPIMFRLAGADWNGTLVAIYQPLPDADNPKMVKYREFMTKYAPKEQVGAFTANSYGFAELFVEGVRRAGKDLTRQSYLAGLESIKNWSDGINPNVTLGPDDHRAVEVVAFAVAENGKYRQLTDFRGPKK